MMTDKYYFTGMQGMTSFVICHIVSAILPLLSVCREPGCGSIVPQEDMKIYFQGFWSVFDRNVSNNFNEGAMMVVDGCCINPGGGHAFKWQSSPSYERKGGGRVSSHLNTELAALTILTGLHFSPLLCSEIYTIQHKCSGILPSP